MYAAWFFIWVPWPCHSSLCRPFPSNTCKLSISSLTNTHPFVHLHVYSWHDSHCGTSRGCWRKSGRALWISTLTNFKGRQTQRNKKMPKFNCSTTLGIVIWNEHSRHYTWNVRRRYIQITSSRWRLERCTFQRNKHALFSIADSPRQANIKRQGRSKTCGATMSHPADKYGEPWDSTACGSACYL